MTDSARPGCKDAGRGTCLAGAALDHHEPALAHSAGRLGVGVRGTGIRSLELSLRKGSARLCAGSESQQTCSISSPSSCGTSSSLSLMFPGERNVVKRVSVTDGPSDVVRTTDLCAQYNVSSSSRPLLS